MFTARASHVLAISNFKLDILHVSKSSHQENRKYCAICNQVVQYIVLNNGCLNHYVNISVLKKFTLRTVFFLSYLLLILHKIICRRFVLESP